MDNIYIGMHESKIVKREGGGGDIGTLFNFFYKVKSGREIVHKEIHREGVECARGDSR